jgi:hypothetical protein
MGLAVPGCTLLEIALAEDTSDPCSIYSTCRLIALPIMEFCLRVFGSGYVNKEMLLIFAR